MRHLPLIYSFLQVVKERSFVKAARNLGMTGPALSKQIRALEDELGVRLLNRTTRVVSPTDEGLLYSERAGKALEYLKEVEEEIRELNISPKGTLRINAPMAFGKRFLVKPIAAFANKYPELKLEVDFDDRHIDILAEGYDVVVRVGHLEDSSLVARKLASCPIMLCASPEFIQQYSLPNDPGDLQSLPAIIYTKQGQNLRWNYKNQWGEVNSCQLKRHFLTNNAEAMLEACLQGVGVAILPVFVAIDYLKAGRLIHLMPEYTTHPEREIYALFPQNRYLPIKTRMFVDYLVEEAKSFPW